MLGVGGGGTGIVQAREIESAVYKKLFLDLLSHVCAASPRWGESLLEIAP